MVDLEQLIRQRQDELRGRPQTHWERLRERLPYRDRVLDLIGLGCWIVAGACFTFVAWARLFGGAH
ncbi:MAG: hypothetical protein QHD01_31740 [Bradyrhizobium sp.]|uniref:hypothetical protein n=1 Tax=Bradyrhizobium sp. TaxID=376 RepID=UPI0029B0306E|nr:hypothetical protein [Bradyrhizobium sp.]MDX3971142.1 hypothetical protein [Bradyrhizobium sp.]